MLNKDKFFLYSDRIILFCLCSLIFCLPFAKAGVESFTWFAIFIWILKRVFGYRAGAFWGMLPKTGLHTALGVFIAINALSVIFSVNYGLSLRGFFGKQLKFLAIYFMLVEVINSRVRLRNLLIAIIASAVLIAADAGMQYFGGADFIRGYRWARLTASFVGATGFAGWLIIVIPLFLGLLMTGKVIGKSLKVFLSILVIFLLACLVLTYARGGWMGFIMGIFLISWYVIKNFTLKIKILCLSSCIGLLAIFLILPKPIKDRVKAIGRINFRSGETLNERIKGALKVGELSATMRLNLWREALRIARDYPLTGCGLNTYSITAPNYKSFVDGGVYPHNSYLQMLAETSLLGVFSFLWILFQFFQMGLRHLNQKNNPLVLGLLAGILAFSVHAFFDTHLYSLQLVVLFWFMLGLTVSVIELDRRSGLKQD